MLKSQSGKSHKKKGGKDSTESTNTKRSKNKICSQPSRDKLPENLDLAHMSDWVGTLEVMLTTDTWVEIPDGMQDPRVQAYFLRKYPDYESLQSTLLRELLELPRANTEERDKTDQIWRFCTGLPLPNDARHRSMRDTLETLDRHSRERFHGSPDNQTDGRGAMEALPSTGLRRGLLGFDLDSEQGSGNRELGEVDETDPNILGEIDDAFCAAVKEAWSSGPKPNVRHAYEAFLPMEWEDTDLCRRADREGNFDLLYRQWQAHERSKERNRANRDIDDECWPCHAPKGWKRGDPLPREWDPTLHERDSKKGHNGHSESSDDDSAEGNRTREPPGPRTAPLQLSVLGVDKFEILTSKNISREKILAVKSNYEKIAMTDREHSLWHHYDESLLGWLATVNPNWRETQPREFFDMLLQEYPEQNRRRFTTAEDYVRALDTQLFRVNYGDVTCWNPLFFEIEKIIVALGGTDRINHDQLARALTNVLEKQGPQGRALARVLHPRSTTITDVIRQWYAAGKQNISNVNHYWNWLADMGAIPRFGDPWTPAYAAAGPGEHLPPLFVKQGDHKGDGKGKGKPNAKGPPFPNKIWGKDKPKAKADGENRTRTEST